jgi:hypothetical protein
MAKLTIKHRFNVGFAKGFVPPAKNIDKTFLEWRIRMVNSFTNLEKRQPWFWRS